MAYVPTEQERLRESPTSELFRRLLTDVRLIFGRQAQLAKLELEDKGSRLRTAGVEIAAAVVVGVFGVGVFIAAAVLALTIVLPAWAAALIVGAVLVAVAAVLFLMGRARLRSLGSLAPTETIEAAREDVAWIRRETERLRSTG
ncbi:MAG TPA: phage holin family protein [Actinomycetota bacterium]|nr:phage holin family protein [Actinomycetota bacterium]